MSHSYQYRCIALSVMLPWLLACGWGVGEPGSEGGGGATGSTSSSGTSSTSSSTGSAGSGGASSVVTCNPEGVACDGLPPTCPPGEVASVVDDCWGDCVPILSCPIVSTCLECQGAGMCVVFMDWNTVYRCVQPPLQCSAPSCSCMAPYFCVSPYDACMQTPDGSLITCEAADA